MKGMKLKFRKDRWKIKFEQNNLEEFTYNMKPPHCRTQKCQKLNPIVELVNGTLASSKYHQD
jgi:hypothetical protein